MKKKIFKVIIFIVLLVIAIVLIKFTHNFYYYQKLLKARDKVYELGNYTCYYYNRGEKLDADTGEWTSSYSKMGLKVKGNKAVDYIYSLEDQDKVSSAQYLDKDNDKENFYIDFETNTFQVQPNFVPLEYRMRLINYPIHSLSEYSISLDKTARGIKEKLYYLYQDFISIAFLTNYKTVEEDGKEYIVLGYKNTDTGIYFNKETLLAEKETMITGRTNETVVNAYWEIELGNVTDEDVTVPDLSNFRQSIW